MIPNEVLTQLATLGLSPELSGIVVRMLRAVEDATNRKPDVPDRSVSAIRQARYRERKLLARQSVTKSVTSNVTERNASVTDVTPVTPLPRVRAFSITEEEEIDTPISPSEIAPNRQRNASKRKTLSRLAIDFRPSETMREFGKSHGLSDREIEREGENIRDWSLSAKNGAKLDWEAAWRNWVKNRKPTTSSFVNGHDPFMKPNGQRDIVAEGLFDTWSKRNDVDSDSEEAKHI